MKRSKNDSLLTAIITVAAGLILLLHPGDTLNAAARLIGGALLLIGCVTVVLQLLKKESKSTGAIILAAVEIVLGVVIMSAPGFIVSLFPVIVGILIAASGVSDLLEVNRIRKLGGRWTAALILSVITLILGLVILLNPFKTMAALVRVIGFVLIYQGVTGFFIRKK